MDSHGIWENHSQPKYHFSRLFSLPWKKNVFAKDLVLRIMVDGGCWSWRRNLFVWEVELVHEYKVLLSNISLYQYVWFEILIPMVVFC